MGDGFMFEKVKRQKNEKDALINAVIQIEWVMFDQVQHVNGRASCQDDAWTFYVMRYSQFEPLPVQVLSSYRQDLEEATLQGRNLLTEKYAYMMAYTAPDIYERELKPRLPMISQKKQALIDSMTQWMIEDEKSFAQRYPKIAAKGRPLLESSIDVSVYHYAQGELKTYSMRTLVMYHRYLMSLEASAEGGLAQKIYEVMVTFYGYGSLDEANR